MTASGVGGGGTLPLPPEEARAVLRRAEAWFVRQGLPYFVPDVRRSVHRGLAPARLGLVVALALLGGAAGGVVLGWFAGDVSVGVSLALNVAGLLALLYALTTLRVGPIARWAVRRTLGSLGLLFPLVTRALPLLLLFVTFLFINAEVWQVSANLDGGVMWLAVMLFVAMAVGFLLVRLPEELDTMDDVASGEELVRGTRGTPLESVAQALAGTEVAAETDDTVRGFQRANLILVLLVSQLVQVVLLSLSVFVFFIVFGVVAMKQAVVESWIGESTRYPYELSSLSVELVQVSVFLAAFSGLYFTVYAVTDETYRAQFFTSVTRELERAVAARAAYRALRATLRPDRPG